MYLDTQLLLNPHRTSVPALISNNLFISHFQYIFQNLNRNGDAQSMQIEQVQINFVKLFLNTTNHQELMDMLITNKLLLGNGLISLFTYKNICKYCGVRANFDFNKCLCNNCA
ncbi:Hypothetical_protein [Hexamita inflata]|uniref:Hypothetical_protein n=1 Tax=Hexamita inflata TaxID=28002 RepID=A0AA86V072_9EUKA|nr:Hypothetical protein HINF_LOCUS58951 [Hexamita inflata]